MVVKNIDINFNVRNAKPAFTNVRQVQNAFDDLTRAQKLASQSWQVFEQSLSGQRASFNSLRASLDPVMANSQRYEKILKQVTAAQRSGAASTQEANRVLQLAEQRYLSLGTAAAATTTRVSRLGFGFQNVGLQAQDMAVQFEAGTDINRIIVQQVPQLVSSFGALGSSMAIWTGAIGAAVAIGGTLISLMRKSRDTAESLDKALEGLGGIMSDVDSAMTLVNLTTEEMIEKFGRSARAVRELAVAQAEIALSQAAARMRDEISVASDLISTYGEGRRVIDDFGEAQDDISQNLRAIMRDFDVTAGEANRLYDAFALLSDPAIAPEVLEEALDRILETMQSGNNELSDMPRGVQAIVDSMIDFRLETEAAEVAMNNLNAAINRQNTGVPLYEQGLPDSELLPGSFLNNTPEEGGGGGGRRSGGGGSGGGNKRESEIESLIETLMTEQEIVDQFREESLQKLEEADEKELAAIGGFNAAKVRLEEEYQRRVRAIKIKGKESDLSIALAAGSDVLGALGAFNDKALKISQVFGAAQTLISTYQGAAEALKLPFPANLKAAATVLTAGFGFLASLKSVSASSSSGGASGSTSVPSGTSTQQEAATSAVAGDVATTTYVNINLQGQGGVSRSAFSGLIEDINERIEDGAILGGIRVSGGA